MLLSPDTMEVRLVDTHNMLWAHFSRFQQQMGGNISHWSGEQDTERAQKDILMANIAKIGACEVRSMDV